MLCLPTDEGREHKHANGEGLQARWRCFNICPCFRACGSASFVRSVRVGNSQDIPEFGEVPGIIDLIFSTEAGSIVEQPITSDKGAHIVKVLKHEQESQKTFEDVKRDIYTALRSQKEQDIQQQLFENLKKKYDIVIHQSAFAPEKSDEINEEADN